MGEFRDRMERDLQIRGFSPSTQQCYLARMKAMVRFFMRSPDELTIEDINAYQQHLTRDRKVGWGTFNQTVGAIRFFYGVTLEKDWDIQRIPYQKTGRKLPVVLSCEEVSRLFEAVTNLKHRAMLMTAYAAGLRASEVTHLRGGDIDGQPNDLVGTIPTAALDAKPVGSSASAHRRFEHEHRERLSRTPCAPLAAGNCGRRTRLRFEAKTGLHRAIGTPSRTASGAEHLISDVRDLLPLPAKRPTPSNQPAGGLEQSP